jgi:hypothetical protein
MSYVSMAMTGTTLVPFEKVFTCYGKCVASRPDCDTHCYDCRTLLMLLYGLGIGKCLDSLLENIVKHNKWAQEWKRTLDLMIHFSTEHVPMALYHAMRARGLRTKWKRVEVGSTPVTELVGVSESNPKVYQITAKSMAPGMCIFVNAGDGTPRARLHVISINAAIMLHALLMLPGNATPADALAVVSRFTMALDIE